MRTPREQAIQLVLDELAGKVELLMQWLAAVRAEAEAEAKAEATGDEAGGAGCQESANSPLPKPSWPLSTGAPIPLSQDRRRALTQLRLFAALITPEPPVGPAGPVVAPVAAPQPPNLTVEGLSAPRSALDGLLTVACGAIQLATGLHLLGGIAAVLHGAGRFTAPDSLFTKAMSTVRKMLTPDVTVIQETVAMMAPLPVNERSGLRDTLALAAHEITGLEVGVLKHQLFAPEKPEVEEQLATELSEPDGFLAIKDIGDEEIETWSRDRRRFRRVKHQPKPEPKPVPKLDQVSEQGWHESLAELPPPHPPHKSQGPESTPPPDPPDEHGIGDIGI
ncbi:hypothetical protein ACWGLE_13355 [Streptomyces sp. NPDC055897]